MKHLFIVNPVAGGKDSTEAVSAQVAQAFSGREGDFEIYTTTEPMDACRKIEREAALCNELRVYACGGCAMYARLRAGVHTNPLAFFYRYMNRSHLIIPL